MKWEVRQASLTKTELDVAIKEYMTKHHGINVTKVDVLFKKGKLINKVMLTVKDED